MKRQVFIGLVESTNCIHNPNIMKKTTSREAGENKKTDKQSHFLYAGPTTPNNTKKVHLFPHRKKDALHKQNKQ